MLFCVKCIICVLCLIVVPLPPGNTHLQLKEVIIINFLSRIVLTDEAKFHAYGRVSRYNRVVLCSKDNLQRTEYRWMYTELQMTLIVKCLAHSNFPLVC
jgi:hypothetical protein